MAQIITSRNVQLYQTTAIETDPTNLLYAGARDIKWQVDLLPPKTRIYLYINNIPLSKRFNKILIGIIFILCTISLKYITRPFL